MMEGFRLRHAFDPKVAALVVGAALCSAACFRQEAPAWPGYDLLAAPLPAAARRVAGVAVSEADYQRILSWGASWFRYETFGGERMTTDVVGLLDAPIQVPCASVGSPNEGCVRTESTRSYFVRALDALDGVSGNLYSGNGGPDGTGFTHDLVLRFPPGTRLRGLPLPEEVHTGLDVEAGSSWPIGLSAVPTSAEDASLPYVWSLEKLGAGPAPGVKSVRVGITCALCHYSLDVDWDGKTDLKSARFGQKTPGSAYLPEQSWAVGNQDLKVGWLFAMSQNPIVGFAIFSGAIGNTTPEGAYDWVKWVKESYRVAPESVAREVVRGMLLQPRGYADVSSNARYNASQFPPLLTQHYWPSNSDGAVLNGADRNSVVWTTTMDFSGLVGLARDRGGSQSGALYWEEKSIYDLFTAKELAELMVHGAPATLFDPKREAELRDDILGVSDGVPGMMDPDSVYVMEGPGGVIPPEILNSPKNQRAGRIRKASDFGGDAALRGPLLALLGMRTHTRPKTAADPELTALVQRYPDLKVDELTGEAVNAVLDWEPSPPNLSQRLARASALVPRGYEVFKAEGCVNCHRGPFTTDNTIHRISARRAGEIGIAAPSTAGFRSLGRGSGPAIESNSDRAWDSRKLTLYVDPSYDPRTGLAVAQGSPLRGLFGNQIVGYKSTHLRYLWGSAPYLHDGGVGVAIAPSSQIDRDDLGQVLRLPSADKMFGMGSILAYQEANPNRWLRADAALSLQALLLRAEREQVLARRHTALVPVPGVGQAENPLGAPAFVSAEQLGISGSGHEFYIEDAPGGERITALVAFLLALDDAPGELPKRSQ
jgi:hypothetical protein